MGPIEALEAATRSGTLPANEHLLVACSGGRDSMALCHALLRMGAWRLTVATVDHGLRPNSGADADFVGRMAAAWGLPCERRSADVAAIRAGEGLEDGARRERRRLLESARVAAGADRVLLAHTADDQLETVLMRLAAGSGASGLQGMRPVVGVFARPWLSVSRRAVAEYAVAEAVPFREDPSNAEPRFLRNRVRASVLPAFAAVFGDGGLGGASRTAALLAVETEALDALLAPLLSRLEVPLPSDVPPVAASIGLDVRRLRELEAPVRAVAIHRWVMQLYSRAGRAPPRTLHGRIARVDAAVVAGHGAAVGSRDGFTFRQSGGRGVLELT